MKNIARLSSVLTMVISFALFISCNNEADSGQDKKESTIEMTKINSAFINTTWLLETIDGNKVDYPADYKQNYIIFTGEAEGFKVNGFSGCNNFLGSYDVGDHNEIGMNGLASTKMMCPFADLESKYLDVLGKVNKYEIEGFYMIFYDGDKKLATFKDAKELRNH